MQTESIQKHLSLQNFLKTVFTYLNMACFSAYRFNNAN